VITPGQTGSPDLTIRYYTTASAGHPTGPTTTINGRTAYFDHSLPGAITLVIVGKGFELQVEDSGHDDAATREKVLKIARGLQLAPDPQNTATWFDAATAIP
jgi:hypothetical protein